MPLDGISAHFLAHELDTRLSGARIDKIYQPSRFEIYFTVRSNSENYKLLLCCDPQNPRVQITSSMRENPQMPPNFCMLLRKYLQGSRILGFECPGYERIIRIALSTTDELHDTSTKYLVIEMMGRYSNIIFLNAENRIMDALVHVDSSTSRVREIMPARIYEAPPSQNKILPEEAQRILSEGNLPISEDSTSRPVGKAILDSLMGFSPLLSNDICFQADIDPRKGFATLSSDEKDSLRNVLSTVVSDITGLSAHPTVLYIDNEPKDWHALALKDGLHKSVATLSEALDTVSGFHEEQLRFENRRRQLRTIISNALTHVSKKLSIHETDMADSSNADKLKEQGELLLAYQYLDAQGQTALTIPDYPDFGQTTVIPIEPGMTAAEQGKLYLKQYRKATSRYEAAQRFVAEETEEVNYLQSLILALDAASEDEDLQAIDYELKAEGVRDSEVKESKSRTPEKYYPGKSKSGKTSSRSLRQAAEAARRRQQKNKNPKKDQDLSEPRRFYVDGHFEVLSGRNNIQNDNLTFSIADKGDIWFHAKNMPGTHVILRTNGRTPSDKALVEAASIAAYYSKSNKAFSGETEGNKTEYEFRVDIDYCPVSHVKKIPKAKPGMVIYEDYNTLYVSAQLPSHPEKKQ